MGRELIEAFDRADADDEVRVIIVTGAGRAYCAGADLGGGGQTFDWREREHNGAVPRDNGGQFTLRVFESTKPVIAAINGPAVGVGATMTLPMDIRLAADDARIGFVFARRGIVPEACSSWFLPRVVGISQAMEWVATGRVFSAQEALAGRARTQPAPRRRAARRRHGARARDRREHRAGVGGARQAHAVEDARRGAPDARAPGRLARDVRSRPVGRRGRGGHVVPGEASGPVQRQRERGPARDHARLGEPVVRVAAPAPFDVRRPPGGGRRRREYSELASLG